jgi:flagellar basal-body rod protein FlgG
MMKGIYTPLSGALAQERVLEVISNNLANLSTTAFKGENVSFTVLDSEPKENYKTPFAPAGFKFDIQDALPLRGNEMRYVGVAEVKRDLNLGPVVETKNPTDMMIAGKGYFTLMTDEGLRYTRDGGFSLSAEGVLMSKGGHPVLGEKGNIYLRSGQFEVNPRGEIYQGGEFVDRIVMHEFADEKSLERVGNNLFFYGGEEEGRTRVTDAAVYQGKLEGSNVNAMKNMTAMIMAHRSYEAYQKAVSNYDSILEKSANTIGEIRA